MLPIPVTYAVTWFFILGMASWPTFAFADIQVLEIALSRSIQNRNPVHRYNPKIICEKNQKKFGKIPIINPSLDSTAVFWNRLVSTSPERVQHKWHRKIDTHWEVVASINMEVATSHSFRIWSTKDLMSSLHQGEWMIVVSPADRPKEVLCIARFLVQ